MQHNYNQDDSEYIEKWVVVQNDHQYDLTDAQSKLLKKEIASGNRGIVQFKDVAINIPFIQEFYQKTKELKPRDIPGDPVEPKFLDQYGCEKELGDLTEDQYFDVMAYRLRRQGKI
jgi:hypothetical protein